MSNDPSPLKYMGTQSEETVVMEDWYGHLPTPLPDDDRCDQAGTRVDGIEVQKWRCV
jgi:hypothetical protein